MTFTLSLAKQFVDDLLFSSTGYHLTDLEAQVLQGAWEGKSYIEIAQQCGYTPEYINSDVGFGLWRKLTNVLSEKVGKRSFKAALERAWRQSQASEHTITSSSRSPLKHTEAANAFYVERPPIEDLCYQTIRQPGALIRIKAPKKMGKTWLMDQILVAANNLGYHVIPFNFLLLEANEVGKLELLLRTLCIYVARRLQLPNHLKDYWDEGLGSNTGCTAYFEEYILTNVHQPIVLALDNVDRLFPHNVVASNFFSMLRAWYEDARILPKWKNVRIIIVHSTEVYPKLNINQSPFNVGLEIVLPEFTRPQVNKLAQHYDISKKMGIKMEDLEDLINIVGGHPYLIKHAFDYLVNHTETDLKTLIQTIDTEEGIYQIHLRRQLDYLKKTEGLAMAMKTVVESSTPKKIDSKYGFMLHSLGLVRLRGNEVEPSCMLYRLYFRELLAEV